MGAAWAMPVPLPWATWYKSSALLTWVDRSPGWSRPGLHAVRETRALRRGFRGQCEVASVVAGRAVGPGALDGQP